MMRIMPKLGFKKHTCFLVMYFMYRFKKEGRVNGLAQHRYYRSRGSWKDVTY